MDWFAHNARTAAHVARFQSMTLVGGHRSERIAAHRSFLGCPRPRSLPNLRSRVCDQRIGTRRPLAVPHPYIPRATAFVRTTCATFAWASLAVDLDLRLKERNIPFVLYSGFSKLDGAAAMLSMCLSQLAVTCSWPRFWIYYAVVPLSTSTS